MIDEALLDMLVCPRCKSPVKPAGEELVCMKPECSLRYPVRNGIPIMLIDEAKNPQATPKANAPHA